MYTTNRDETKAIFNLICKQELDKAKERIQIYLTKYPNDPEIKALIVKYYNEIHDAQTAYAYARSYFNEDHGNRRSYTTFMKEYIKAAMSLGEFNEAEKVAKIGIIHTNGKSFKFVKLLADVYYYNGDIDGALGVYETYKAPNTEVICDFNMMQLYCENKDYDICLEIAQNVPDWRLDHSQRQKKHYYMGVAYKNKGLYSQALREFKSINEKGNIYFVKAKKEMIEMRESIFTNNEVTTPYFNDNILGDRSKKLEPENSEKI